MNDDAAALMYAALGYALRGWPVIPLHFPRDGACSCGKADCRSPAKHPLTSHGLKDATLDADRIRGWWRRWPNANIGVPTGVVSGIVGLDVDNKPGVRGNASLEALAPEGWEPRTLTSLTGTGRHHLYQYPDQPIRSSASRIGDGLDIRGDGGYLVVPPSLHISGTRYRWEDPSTSVARMPDWLLNGILAPSPAALPTAFPEVPAEEIITEGKRNSSLTSAAGLLRWAGMQPAEIEALLRIHNELLCDPPVGNDELARIAQSIGGKPPGRDNPDIYWFKFKPDVWFSRSHRLMRDYQHGWLMNLLSHALERGGTLPGELDSLAVLACADSPDFFARESGIVLEQFELHEVTGRKLLVHPGMAKDFLKTVTTCFKNRINGKKGGKRNGGRRAGDQRGEDDWNFAQE